jgi:hypothetical protein
LGDAYNKIGGIVFKRSLLKEKFDIVYREKEELGRQLESFSNFFLLKFLFEFIFSFSDEEFFIFKINTL